MNLVIDQGNTFTKFGVFDKGKLTHTDSCKNLDQKFISDIFGRFSIDQVIISSVQHHFESFTEVRTLLKINSSVLIHILGTNSKLPIKNNYKTPHTLGKDRVAALVGAYSPDKGIPKLIIDAGTAITIDYLDENNIFQGGNISPGLQTRFNALHQNTQKLPLLKAMDDSPFMGLTTQEAICSGVQNGIFFEIDAYINHYKQLNNNTKAILTGGDAYFFAKNLKNPIFVDLNLVLTGLNTILEYNAKNK